MSEVIIIRDYHDNITWGRLLINKEFFCDTLERPKSYKNQENLRDDKATQINESCCIPEGIYDVKKRYSNKFKRNCYEIQNVKNRSSILIHPANYVSELLGCIALGKADIQNNILTISKKTVEEFEKIMSETFKLEITSLK